MALTQWRLRRGGGAIGVGILTFSLALSFAAAQPKRELIIDGNLRDAFWRDSAAQRFVASQPGAATIAGGDVRAVVVGRYLCVAARLPEPTGRFTGRLTGRNPSWEEEDAIRILAGANIGYTDRILQVNPLGAYSIEKAVRVKYRNVAVFPYSDEWERDVVYRDADKFLAATSRGEKEWDVEVAIPLNQLSAPGPDHIFVRVERIRAARVGSPGERWHWPAQGPAAKVPVDPSVKWDAPPPLYRPAQLGNQQAPIEAGRRQEVPPMDRKWDDAAWQDVLVWRLLRDEVGGRLPKVATEVKLLHDRKTLAVMARCAEPGAIRASVRENDGPVNQDDSFHVYLATSGSAYAQFAINPLGYLLDNMGFAGGQRLSRAREWSSGARTAVSTERGAWTVRMDIPLEPVAQALGETELPVEWRILLMRVRPGRDGEPSETSVLPVIESETALCPARYRRLTLLGGPAPPHAGEEREPGAASASFETRVLSDGQRKEMDLAHMLEKQIHGRALRNLEAEREERNRLQTQSDWERFRDPRLKALADFIGPFPARTALATRVTKEFAGQGYRRQDLVYQSRPGLWVTANLYLPVQPTQRMPGMVIIHSHHRPRTQAELQDMGILWARSGCAVLIMDQIGHGERIQTYPWNREAYHSRYVMGMQLYVAGESLIKWMVWDIMRGVDLLLDRPDVNKDQILLLGAVAAGGDPAAVTAALDPRIAAVVPFNFGEATPRTNGTRSSQQEGLADPGSGSWESTRNLPGSISKQYLPWMICASVAPRRLVYSFEMGWQVEQQPAWARYQKIFGFYGAVDHLAEAHGFGGFPGPGECANIGPSQRQTLYPSLKRWFDIPIPSSEPDDRRPENELASLTPAIAADLKMRSIHDLAHEVAASKLNRARTELSSMAPDARRRWLRSNWAAKLGDIEPNRLPEATSHWKKQWRNAEVEGITLQTERGIVVPILLLRPTSKAATPAPLVIALSEGGKEGFIDHRGDELEALLQSGVAVCLADVRGTGETAPDMRRHPSAGEISLADTELMLGNTLLGARLKDLRTVMAYLRKRPEFDSSRMAYWGDSFAPVNPERVPLDEMQGWRIGPYIQHQAEPLGGLLALLGALYEDGLRAVALRAGLVNYLSILDDAFAYVPEDVVVPGIVAAGDLPDVAAALAPCPLLLEGLVDAKNRVVSEPALRSAISPAYESYRTSPSRLLVRSKKQSPNLPQWLTSHLSR
jgi:cephalosporin-C deacetylase-like acetyl esterase